MKSYQISITITTYGMEKGTIRLIRANSEKEAVKEAEQYAFDNFPEAHFIKAKPFKLY